MAGREDKLHWAIAAAAAAAGGAAYVRWAWGPDARSVNATNPYLSRGNHAPVRDEVHSRRVVSTEAEAGADDVRPVELGVAVIRGTIPAGLRGGILRIGPNSDPEMPRAEERGDDTPHWFDGDGCAHATLILDDDEEGDAESKSGDTVALSYSNHQIRTTRLEQQRKLGRPIAPGVGTFTGLRGIWRMLNFGWHQRGLSQKEAADAHNPANTALVFHARKLLALCEAGAPFALRLLADGHYESLGFHYFGGKLRHAFTAHPKVCPVTGNLFFFGYSLVAKPYLSYAWATPDGTLVRSIDVKLPHAAMMHDMAITRTAAILIDIPVRFNVANALSGKQWFDHFPAGSCTRFGLLPRETATSADDIEWFEASPCFVFHTFNAYDSADGREVVIHGVRYETDAFWLAFGHGRDANMRVLSTDHADSPSLRGEPWEWRINRGSRKVTERRIATGIYGEFPQVNKQYVGLQARYGYVGVEGEANTGVLEGVAKVDLESGEILGTVSYGGTRRGGEMVFVPRPLATAEDDGWLCGYVHDESRDDSSEVWVLDAKTMASVPVCVLRTPQVSSTPSPLLQSTLSLLTLVYLSGCRTGSMRFG